MTGVSLAYIVSVITTVMSILIFLRAIMSWIPNLNPHNPIAEFLYTVTEPILAPLRRIIPRMGMMDLTPMIAILLLQLVGRAIVRG